MITQLCTPLCLTVVISFTVWRNPAVHISMTQPMDKQVSPPLTQMYLGESAQTETYFTHDLKSSCQTCIVACAPIHTQVCCASPTLFLHTCGQTRAIKHRLSTHTNTHSVSPLAVSIRFCMPSVSTSHLGLFLSSFVFSAGRSQTLK